MSSPRVDFYFDPLCPWAWITSRWVLEVDRQRELALSFRLMSVAELNRRRPRQIVKQRILRRKDAWRPVRVGAALLEKSGEPALRDFYTAFGTRYHEHGQRDGDAVLAAALAEVGAGELLAAADGTAYDEAVRVSHRAGVAPVGPRVGTPILHIDGAAVFGPVLNAVPRGQAALDLFDSTVVLARHPNFFELKRGRDGVRVSFG